MISENSVDHNITPISNSQTLRIQLSSEHHTFPLSKDTLKINQKQSQSNEVLL